MTRRATRSLVLLLSAIISAPLFADGSPPVQVGVAKVDVTPRGPVVLAGYGGRTTEHEGIDTRLWARAIVIGDAQPVAMVVLDNSGVPGDVSAQLARRLAQYDISADRLVVAATHTHNAPTLVGYASIVWAGRTTP